jgi:pimeloyl-ACP methyl ester carboxylesterase
MTVDIEHARIPANGLTFNVALAGPSEGPPVMLLHGFPDSGAMWRHQITALAEAGFRVVAPDLRGFGESDRPDQVDAYRMRVLVADVTGILDALELGSVRLVGHDWGAALAWAVAAFAPSRVTRLVAISVGHPLASIDAGLHQRQLSWYMLWFLFPGVAEEILPRDDWSFFRGWAWRDAAETDADLERQIADLSRPGALSAGLNWYRANIDPRRYAETDSSTAAFPHVGCPTMGVWSDGDPTLGHDQMALSQRYVDGPWRFERIEGCDHWVPVHAPEQLNGLLLSFLG